MANSAKLTIRMSEAEARILRAQSIRHGVSLSAFARQKILHGGGADAVNSEETVNQILPVVQARFDELADEIQAIKSDARQIDERASDRLKKSVQIIFEEIRKK